MKAKGKFIDHSGGVWRSSIAHDKRKRRGKAQVKSQLSTRKEENTPRSRKLGRF